MDALQRKNQQIQQAVAQLRSLTKNSPVMSPQAQKLADRIRRLTAERDAMHDEATTSLGAALPKDEAYRNEVYRQMVKIPIVADYLYACCVELRGILKRHGIDELTLTRQVRQLKEQSAQLAFMLSHFESLEQILSSDDTLISALDKKVDSFINRHLHITT